MSSTTSHVRLSILPCPACLCAATQKFYIVAGQHCFVSTQRIREEKLRNNQPVPRWTTRFQCAVVKDGVDAHDVEMVSGRAQAQSTNVMAMSFADTVEVLWKLLQRHQQQHGAVPPNRTQILIECYGKTGKTTTIDNTAVC